MVEIQIDSSEDIWEAPSPFYQKKPFVFFVTGLSFFVVVTLLGIALMSIDVKHTPPTNTSDTNGWGEEYPEWAKRASFSPNDFDNCVVAGEKNEEEKQSVVCWRYEKEREKERKDRRGMGEGDKVVLGVVVKEGGGEGGSFVGLGVSDNGGMIGADIVTFSPEIGLQDRFSTKFGKPLPDNDFLTNIELVSGGRDGDSLSFSYRRAVRVCEEGKTQDLDILPGKTNVVWATGDVVRGDISYHGKRKGSIELDLLGGKGTGNVWEGGEGVTEFGESVVPYQFLMADKEGEPILLEKYATKRDSYLRKMFKADFFDEKQHILEINAVVDNADHVHHMTLSKCLDLQENKTEALAASFLEPTLDDPAWWCIEISSIWAVGGQKLFQFPQNVGLAVGEEGHIDYFRLEVHYNMAIPGGPPTDNSGFEIRVGEPREIEAGLMYFGWDISPTAFILPPGEKEVTKETYLTTDVLNRIPVDETGEGEVTVFKSFVHMHRYGRKGVVQHYRGGEEIEPMRGKEYYDFNSQRWDDQLTSVQHGDSMKLTCYYDTSEAKEPVTGGEGTENEMCFYFMFYYPRVQGSQDLAASTLQDTGEQQFMYIGMDDDNKPLLIWLDKSSIDSQEAYVPPPRQKCTNVVINNDDNDNNNDDNDNNNDDNDNNNDDDSDGY